MADFAEVYGDESHRIEAAAQMVDQTLRVLDLRSRVLGSIDAVLTATALHWLTPERVGGVYAEATSLLTHGGVLVNTETVPDPGLPSLAGELERINEDRGAWLRTAGGVPTWRSAPPGGWRFPADL